MIYELPPITGGMVLGTEDEADMGLREEFERMRAEIERLRAALKPFAKMYAAPGGDMDKAIAEARRALEPKP